MLCARAASLPFTMSFLGGGEGLSGAGDTVGGFGARLGLPWLTRGRSVRSDVDRDAAGAGVGGADDNDVIEPPGMKAKSIEVVSPPL